MKKLFANIKKIAYEYRYFLFVCLITLIVISIQFPYYIKKDGGTINVMDRITIVDSYEKEGTLKMAYVAELRATIPSLVAAWLFNWDIVPLEEEVSSNETISDNDYRNKLLLNEANKSAIIAAYQTAAKNISITSVDYYVSYIDPNAKTSLKIGDKIKTINDIEINSLDDIKAIINSHKENDKIEIVVERKNKETTATAELYSYDESIIIGVLLTADYDIKENITFHFKSSESGPSGGLMMSLAIYNCITKEDLIKKRNIVGTGTIDIDGTVGEISGVKYKLKSAVKDKADIFLVPSGENYEEAIREKNKHNYDIDIIEVNNLKEAIEYLKK